MSGHRLMLTALVATCNRPGLLSRRALPSIAAQNPLPALTIVVDDSASNVRSRNKRATLEFSAAVQAPAAYVHNRRTSGASGAWNTGALEALKRLGDPDRIWLAMLDDDDEWTPRHLDSIFRAIHAGAPDIVASAFERRASGRGIVVAPPEQPSPRDFFIGNPGVVGSSLAVRLSTFLRAGMFDESLPACTDRDLLARVFMLPDARCLPLSEATLTHHADADRPRLSNYQDGKRLVGLSRFSEKWDGWMTPATRRASHARARKIFGWRKPPSSPLPRATGEGKRGTRREPDAAEKISLIVGAIAASNQCGGLFSDLLELSRNGDLLSLDVLIMPLSDGDIEGLEREMSCWRKSGLRAHLINVRRPPGDLRALFDLGRWRGKTRPVAVNRGILQLFASRVALRLRNPVCWLLDGDIRLFATQLIGGKTRGTRPDYVGEMMRLRAAGADIAVGEINGAAPLPRALTVRTQMVDLLHLMGRLRNQAPESRILRRNALAVRANDYHHDCGAHAQLEFPAGMTPPGVRVAADFPRALPRLLERILAGDMVTRPLLSSKCPPAKIHRGGNTLAFNPAALLEIPNGFVRGPLASARRQDEIWLSLNKALSGRDVVFGGPAVTQIRENDPPRAPDIDRLAEDIVGRAFALAVDEILSARRFSDPAAIADDLARNSARLFERARFHADWRMAEVTASFHRVCGLAESMRALMEAPDAWWAAPSFGKARKSAINSLNGVARRFSRSVRSRLVRRVDRRLSESLNAAMLADFSDVVRWHDAADGGWDSWFHRERTKNARALVERAHPNSRAMKFLGAGREGAVFTDGSVAVKVLHRWDSRRDLRDREFLPSLAGKGAEDGAFPPVLDWRRDGGDALLTFAYEKTLPYHGGRGAEMTAMLASMIKRGVLHQNLKPANLRRRGRVIRVVDHGGDVRPFTEKGFDLVVRKAWLCHRWGFRGDLPELLTDSLTNPDMPELFGYEKMKTAAKQFGAILSDTAVPAIMRGRPKSILDYGCGRGADAIRMAADGGAVVAYDARMAAEVADNLKAAGVVVAATESELLDMGPFDAILLRRVLCEVRSDSAARKILQNVRALLSPRGRVVVSMCDPNGLVRHTPEAENIFPKGANMDGRFAYRKRLRASESLRGHIHRPERFYLREFARAGFRIAARRETPGVDLERFETCGGILQFTLKPLKAAPKAALVVRACAMDADTPRSGNSAQTRPSRALSRAPG